MKFKKRVKLSQVKSSGKETMFTLIWIYGKKLIKSYKDLTIQKNSELTFIVVGQHSFNEIPSFAKKILKNERNDRDNQSSQILITSASSISTKSSIIL